MKTSVDGLEFKHPNTSRVYLIGFKPYNLKAQYSAVFFLDDNLLPVLILWLKLFTDWLEYCVIS